MNDLVVVVVVVVVVVCFDASSARQEEVSSASSKGQYLVGPVVQAIKQCQLSPFSRPTGDHSPQLRHPSFKTASPSSVEPR